MSSLQRIFSFFFSVVQQVKPAYLIPDKVNCAVIKYHSRRITCLEFHPTKNNILLSGDKVSLAYTNFVQITLLGICYFANWNSGSQCIPLSIHLSHFGFCLFLVHGNRKDKLECGILKKCMRR